MRDTTWHGIPVRRIRMFVPQRPTGLTRMLSDLSFLLSLIRRARFKSWIPDVVVTASPMFSQCLAQRFLYRRSSIPRLIIVQDFVVDAALELGILRLPGLSGLLRFLERWSFRSASTLTTISEPMREKLVGIVGADRKVVCIPNWIHQSIEDGIRKLERSPIARKPRMLSYAGNLGIKQGLPEFLKSWPTETPWELQIHGGGAAKEELIPLTQGRTGVRIGGVLPEDEYLRLLMESSACLVTQKSGVGANFLPSKLLPALATGTPVLAVCDRCSPLAEEVRQGEFGLVIEPGDKKALVEVLDCWASGESPLSRFGRNALKRSALYEREPVLARLESELKRLVERRTG